MKIAFSPYVIAVVAGAGFGATAQAYGQVVAVVAGLVLAAAFAFGPPPRALKRERERIGRRASTHAVAAFFFVGLAVWAGLFIIPNLSAGGTLTPSEQQIGRALNWLMSWGLGIAALLWGAFLVRPRKPKDAGALAQKPD